MSSPVSNRSLRHARIDLKKAQPDGEGRSRCIAEQRVGNEPSGLKDSVVDSHPQTPLPASPGSSLSEHSGHIPIPIS